MGSSSNNNSSTPVADATSDALSQPPVGTWVTYRLTGENVFTGLTRRAAGSAFGAGFDGDGLEEGQQLPALVVRSDGAGVNVQVFLDGNDHLWCPDVRVGDQPGQYQA